MTRISRCLRKPELVIVPVVAAAIVALLYLRDTGSRFLLLSIEADARIGPLLSYQLLTFGIALAFVLGVRLIKPKAFKRFGRWGDISAEFRRVPQIGLRAGPGENW